MLDLSGTSSWRAPWDQKIGTHGFSSIFSPTKKTFWEQNWNELNRPWLRLLELSPTFPRIRWDWSILVAVISKRSRPLTKQGAPSKKVQRCRGVQINVCHKLGLLWCTSGDLNLLTRHPAEPLKRVWPKRPLMRRFWRCFLGLQVAMWAKILGRLANMRHFFDTVDGRNPAPVDRFLTVFFLHPQVVQDFFHQQ